MSTTTRRACLIALLLTIGAIVPLEGTTARQSQPAGAYVALGDSIAYGVGASLPERRSYPVLVRQYLELHGGGVAQFANLAIPGETAATFLSEGQFDAFDREVGVLDEAGIRLDVVTVTLGGNELLAEQDTSSDARQAALDDFDRTMDRALADIRARIGPEPTIVVTTYYDLSAGDATMSSSDAWWIEQFNLVIRQVAERQSAVVAELPELFRGQIDEFTYHPYDVHPNNQGYRAIAREVWHSLRFDQEPPQIEVVSANEASRRTPTLQLQVTDNVDVARVSVMMNDGSIETPVYRGDGNWALLLDLRDGDVDEYALRIQAEDSAGNRSEIEHRIVIQAD